MTLNAIPTEYKGIPMRSKLETQVAAMFDRHKIAWEYEKEGYDLDGTWYLPDFWLPDQNTFVEVKPNLQTISKEDWRKILLLTAHASDDEKHVVVWTHPTPDSLGRLVGHYMEAALVERYITYNPLPWTLKYAPLGSKILVLDDESAPIERCPTCGVTWVRLGMNRMICGNGCEATDDPLYQIDTVKETPLPGARGLDVLSERVGDMLKQYYRYLDGKLACLGDRFSSERYPGNAAFFGIFPSAYREASH